MKVTINFIEEFLRQAKPLRKKYPSFEEDYFHFLDELVENPFMGTPLGGGVRKVRMAILSKGKGKSGGARILTYCLNQVDDEHIEVTLLTIYDKSKIANVSENYIRSLVSQLSKCSNQGSK